MNLTELNDRWHAIGQPYAMPRYNAWVFCCPFCGKTGSIELPLHAAMSDALAHKNHCSAIK